MKRMLLLIEYMCATWGDWYLPAHYTISEPFSLADECIFCWFAVQMPSAPSPTTINTTSTCIGWQHLKHCLLGPVMTLQSPSH